MKSTPRGVVQVALTLGLSILMIAMISDLSHSKKNGTGTIKVAGKTIKIDFLKHKNADPKVKCKDCHVKHKCEKYHRKDCNGCHGTGKKVDQHGLKHEIAPTMAKVVTKTCIKCHTKRKKAGQKSGPLTLGAFK